MNAAQIAHRDKRYAGLHPPIIEQGIWDCVQARLADNTQGEKRARLPHRSLLAGLIVDEAGEPMLASHATKKSVRYRYYISRSLQTGDSSEGLRLPAREIEQLVKEQVAQVFDDPLALALRLSLDITPARLGVLDRRCAELAGALRAQRGEAVRDVVVRITAGSRRLAIGLSPTAITKALGVECSDDTPPLQLDAEYRLTRTGRAVRLVQSDGSRSGSEADPALIGLIAKARKWWTMLAAGEADITALAEREGCTDSYITRIVRIAFLSPEVVDAILAGKQHGALDAAQLRLSRDIPARWNEQAVRFLPATARRHSNGAAG